MFLWILFYWVFLLHNHMSSFCKNIICNLPFEYLIAWSKRGKCALMHHSYLFIFTFLFPCKHYVSFNNTKWIYSYDGQKLWNTLEFSMNQNVVRIHYLLLMHSIVSIFILIIDRFIRRFAITIHKLPCGHNAFLLTIKINISTFISLFQWSI